MTPIEIVMGVIIAAGIYFLVVLFYIGVKAYRRAWMEWDAMTEEEKEQWNTMTREEKEQWRTRNDSQG